MNDDILGELHVACDALADATARAAERLMQRNEVLWRLRARGIPVAKIAEIAGISENRCRAILRGWDDRSYGSALADLALMEAEIG